MYTKHLRRDITATAINKNTDYHKPGADKHNIVKIRVNATIILSVNTYVKTTSELLYHAGLRRC